MEETWQNYSLEDAAHRETLTTDANGTVVFPARLRYAGVLRRSLGCANQWRRYAYHASCGPHSWIYIFYPPGYGQNDQPEFAQAQLWYDGGAASRNNVVVIRKCRNGGTGITCFLPK